MKGFKGFAPGLFCRGKQYAENTVFEEKKAEICERGMHFCANPFDVLDHYDLVNGDGDFNEFAPVEALDEVKTNDNKKYCTKKLKVCAKLSFAGFVKACVDFVLEKTVDGMPDCNVDSGDSAQIGSSGDSAQIGSSGDSAKIGSSGADSVICCAGHDSCVKAKKGSWITLSEWEYNHEKERCVPVCVKTEYVDGERIKEDVFYCLKNGEFVETNGED